jgi:hypothetical protein
MYGYATDLQMRQELNFSKLTAEVQFLPQLPCHHQDKLSIHHAAPTVTSAPTVLSAQVDQPRMSLTPPSSR